MSLSVRRLVGFDMRRYPEDYVSVVWDRRRRELHLLRSDVNWPLSVDSLVWPTIFSYPPVIEGMAPPYTFATIVADSKYAEHGLWSNLAEMRQFYERTPQHGRIRGVEVRIELFADARLTSDQLGSFLVEENVAAAESPASAVFLGYDIADSGLISGLTNCGYEMGEKKRLGVEWSGRLNDYGLLRSLEDALAFKEITNKRVAEHAPFWVFGLTRLC